MTHWPQWSARASTRRWKTCARRISDEILATKKRRIRDELREQALQAVIDQATITLHPLLVQEEVNEMLHQFSHMLEQQRMSMDQYLMMMRKSAEEYKKELEPDAENRVKRELVLDALANQEAIYRRAGRTRCDLPRLRSGRTAFAANGGAGTRTRW